MSSTHHRPTRDSSESQTQMNTKRPWKELVEEHMRSGRLKGITCCLYKEGTTNDANNDDSCVCGRSIRAHSFTGTPQPRRPVKVERWRAEEHAEDTEVTTYGELENGARFLRYDIEKRPYDIIVDMLEKNVGSKPKLLASIYGGAQYFTMTDALEREFISGIGQLATTKDVWLLTTGLNSGVSKLIGQGIHRSILLRDSVPNIVAIGMNKWGKIDERTREMLKKNEKPIILDENQPNTMDPHHTYFFLLDDGRLIGDLDDKPRSAFVETAQTNTKCHAVTIIVEGGQNTLEVIQSDLMKKRPVVIVHGSGRLATVLGNLLDGVIETKSISMEDVKKQLAHYPALYPRAEDKIILTSKEEQDALTQEVKRRSYAREKHRNTIAAESRGEAVPADGEQIVLTPDEKQGVIAEATKQKASAQEKERADVLEGIMSIMNPTNRKYLSIFRLDRDTDLMNTIVRAVFNSQINNENRKALLELAVDWNCVEGAHDIFKHIQTSSKPSSDNALHGKNIGRAYYPGLFLKALKDNRPQFVDYFLRRYYNPLDTVEFVKEKERTESTAVRQPETISSNGDEKKEKKHTKSPVDFILNYLYQKTENPSVELTFRRPKELKDLDKMYFDFIGPYAESFFEKKSIFDMLRYELRTWCSCCGCGCRCWRRVHPDNNHREHATEEGNATNVHPKQASTCRSRSNGFEGSYDSQEMLRDIFLWSVCENYTDIAFVLLLQIKSRICAALIGAGMAHHLSRESKNPHIRSLYRKHREALEEYASACIDECYRQNRRRACQLLLRQIPLFGNVSCMQVAIAIRSIPFINTDCFNRVLNRQWYDHLEVKSIETTSGLCQFTLHIATFGVFAPRLLQYREKEKDEIMEKDNKHTSDTKQGVNQSKSEDTNTLKEPIERSTRIFDGVDVNYTTADEPWNKWWQFHASPAVMIAYDFALYIWFLLVFSYLMMFHLKSTEEQVNWSEIYVIITVTALLIEEFRRLSVELITRMVERWHWEDMGMLIVYAAPYVLFYIGIGLHFGSKARPDLFTAARIVLAIDLEIWFLFSLRFVSAVKLLGPKLFMIRNMMRDLVSLLYIIFICIAAYGVVSRALTMYNKVEFTAKSVATSVFYRPYWFLYSIVDDEKDALDGIISSDDSSAGQVAEATVNHVLLAFHMLFINILLLSLLVAMLNFSIENVQALNKYFWRYQRYELVREYFEKPMFAFPPLSLLIYVVMAVKLLYRRGRTRYRVFKHIATPTLDTFWTEFEHASTYNYARDLVEENYRSNKKYELKKSFTKPGYTPVTETHSKAKDKSGPFNHTEAVKEMKVIADSQQETQNAIAALKDSVGEMQAQNKELMDNVEWIMKAVKRVKMSKDNLPWVQSEETEQPVDNRSRLTTHKPSS